MLDHISQIILKKLDELDYGMLRHPFYSSNFSPTDYHFFKYLNNFLRKEIFKEQQLKMLSMNSLSPGFKNYIS